MLLGGTTVAGCEKFDICFGGRRQFCKADYLDLGRLLDCNDLKILGCIFTGNKCGIIILVISMPSKAFIFV